MVFPLHPELRAYRTLSCTASPPHTTTDATITHIQIGLVFIGTKVIGFFYYLLLSGMYYYWV